MIDVDRLSGLSPTGQRKAANEAEPPALGFAQRLEFRGGADDLNHGRRPS
jgi:hypothetical protein